MTSPSSKWRILLGVCCTVLATTYLTLWAPSAIDPLRVFAGQHVLALLSVDPNGTTTNPIPYIAPILAVVAALAALPLRSIGCWLAGLCAAISFVPPWYLFAREILRRSTVWGAFPLLQECLYALALLGLISVSVAGVLTDVRRSHSRAIARWQRLLGSGTASVAALLSVYSLQGYITDGDLYVPQFGCRTGLLLTWVRRMPDGILQVRWDWCTWDIAMGVLLGTAILLVTDAAVRSFTVRMRPFDVAGGKGV